jgi:hypothetical protein
MFSLGKRKYGRNDLEGCLEALQARVFPPLGVVDLSCHSRVHPHTYLSAHKLSHPPPRHLEPLNG